MTGNTTQTHLRAIFAAIALTCGLVVGFGGCYSPTLPLPPPVRDGLTVSSPDDRGQVLVRGETGVMDPGEQAVIINLDTLYGWIVPVTEEGFEVYVVANSGDILSIRRQAGDDQGPAIELIVPEPE